LKATLLAVRLDDAARIAISKVSIQETFKLPDRETP
jgi:hypothetical protein